MMPITKTRILTVIFSLFTVFLSSAQKKGLFSKQNVVNQYATVGIGGGTSHYFGDLAAYKYFYYSLYTNVRWNGSINYTRYLTPKMAARVAYSYARIYGDDFTFSQRNLDKLSEKYLRNLSFRNDISEFTLSGLYNILPQYGKGAKGRNSFMPYAALGIGIISNNPKARTPYDPATNTFGPWESLKQYRTSGQGLPGYSKPYSSVALVMPLALGVRVKLGNNFDFTAEAGLRITPSDYLDDVGGNKEYPSAASLNVYGPLSSKLSYRADELFSASTGKSRLFNFISIAEGEFGLPPGGLSPIDNAKDIYEYTTKRGTLKPDSYILTQFTISYIISNNVKCPVIK